MDRPESPVVGAYRSRNAQWVPLTTRKSPRQLSCVVAKNLRQGHVSVFVFGVSFPVGERTPSLEKRLQTGRLAECPRMYAGCATSRRTARCALPERKATDSKPETEECPPRLRLSAQCLWKASSRGEGPLCHLYAARDAAVGCVPRVTHFTASVHRPPSTPLRPLRAHNSYVQLASFAKNPGLCDRALVKPCAEEGFCLSLRSHNRWAAVCLNT